MEEWTEFGIETDCCLVPVIEAGELSRHPYFLEKGQIYASGYVRMHSGIESEELTHSPEKGEHTEEILKELLNISAGELSSWRQAGII